MAKKQKYDQLKNLPTCVAEFISLVIKKMRYRKKVRADVMTELAAHFEDELRQCKTDEEKQTRAEQLIADFGDAKLLAVLLRRAKKRCRPLWRTIVARSFQTLGILILCLIVYITWFLTGKPSVTINYIDELNRIVRPVADDSLNAASLYIQAAEMFKELPDETKELIGKKYDEATVEEKQAMKKFVQEKPEAFELIIAGTKKPYCWRTYKAGEGTEMLSVLMPHLAEYRQIVKTFRWRASLSAEQGKYKDAFDDMLNCYRFGRHVKEGGGTLIEQLVGIALEGLAFGTIKDIVANYNIDSPLLAQLQKQLEEITTGENFVISMKVERLFIYDEIQRCFTEDRFGGGHLYPQRIAQLGNDTVYPTGKVILGLLSDPEDWGSILHTLFLHPNKKQTHQDAEKCYDYWQSLIEMTPAQAKAEGIDIQKQTEEMVKGNLLLQMLVPALWKINELSYRIKADVQATLTILATIRYKQEAGHYPENLQALQEAGYLKELSIDPWSDKPLIYRKTPDGFILYGVGTNFTDDNGEVAQYTEGKRKGKPKRYADEGDWIFWPVQK